MIKHFFSFICMCCLFVACITPKHAPDSGHIIHDFFFPDYYSNRPCVILDTICLPIDSPYYVMTSFVQIIDTAFEEDASYYLDFTRPCYDTTHTLQNDLSNDINIDYNLVIVADTNFVLEGSLEIYSLINHKWLDQLYLDAKNSTWAKEEYGYSPVEELLPYISLLTDRCYSIVRQYSIVYSDSTFDLNNLSLPMTYVKFIVLPSKKEE